MGREVKFIEDRLTRKTTFSRRRATIYNKADALARRYNIDVAVLISSPGEPPYTHGSPCFDDVAEHIRHPGALSSARQARIRQDQAKLDSLTKELELSKEHEIVLREKKETNLKKYNMKDIIDLKLEEFVTFKEKLEALRDELKRKQVEMEASSSRSDTEFSPRQTFLSNKKTYDLRPRTPRYYIE